MNGKLARLEHLFGKIDWKLLRQQKLWLFKQSETSTEAMGLMHLLDSIQDFAVDVMGTPHETVFDFQPEDTTNHAPDSCPR